jgi:leucyl aminopeptidase
MKILFSSQNQLNEQTCLVVGIFEDGRLASSADAAQTAFIKHALNSADFKSKKNESLLLITPPDIKCSQILLIGLGKPEEITPQHLQEFGAKVTACLCKSKANKVTINIYDKALGKASEVAAYIAAGVQARHWTFDIYKTKKADPCGCEEFNIITSNPKEAEANFKSLEAINEGVFLTRHVVSEPPNILYPETMAAKALELEKLGVKVEVLGQEEIKKLGMGALLGVAQGSIREPKLIVLQWLKGKTSQPPLAVVGKGVTFDSGGISIKPSDGMEDMKYDMAGSGVVLGLFKSLALRQAKVNIVGIMGMVENMPSGSAQRPSDVVVSMSGQTIEVVNTDAEGRLILADALWYAQNRFKPKEMIDLATLTGAIKVALGE